jgi:hypothetical protein
MQDTNDTLLNALSRLIGREAMIEQRRVCVVEVLCEGPNLVLSEIGADKMQESLYGQARRRAPRHFQIPLRSEIGKQLHPVVRAFLSAEEITELTPILFSASNSSQ